jgi:hypothetical protein
LPTKPRDLLAPVACIAACLALAACTDGATRIAGDLESAAGKLGRANGSAWTLKHVPESRPEGCAAAYSVQLTAASALVIWCKPSAGAGATSSHITTYHLRFVEVPQTWKIEKAAGDPLYIDLARQDGKAVVVGVR